MFIKRHRSLIVSMVLMIIIPIVNSGCKGEGGSIFSRPSATPQPTATVTLTSTPLPTPTATPEPLALSVNGMGITLAEYQAQLVQIQAADEQLNRQQNTDEQRQKAVDELVDQTLLADAAVKAGFTLSESDLDARIEKLKNDMASPEAFTDWIVKNGYSDSGFRSALRRSIQAAWQRDQILASVPEQVEQIHARQILVSDRATAEDLLLKLDSGRDFLSLASLYDPLTGGDLGWFPRGFLTQPAVEAAAFALQPGQYSGIIETDFGYHIVLVIERDPSHPLSSDARLALQKKALDEWLIDERAAAEINTFLP